MSSRGKKKTTFAKLNREARLRERRVEKAARKEARRYAAVDEAADAASQPMGPDADDSVEPAEAASPISQAGGQS